MLAMDSWFFTLQRKHPLAKMTAAILILSRHRLIELTIGVICSCFPAVNILIERRLSRRSNLSPNSPRSTRKQQKANTQNSGIVASWWGSGLSETYTSVTATSSTADSPAMKKPTGIYDPERSRLAAHPTQMAGMESEDQELEMEHWNYSRNSSLTSSAGRRESWLSQTLRKSSTHGWIMKTVEVSLERSRRQSVRQREAIWDGRRIGSFSNQHRRTGADG